MKGMLMQNKLRKDVEAFKSESGKKKLLINRLIERKGN